MSRVRKERSSLRCGKRRDRSTAGIGRRKDGGLTEEDWGVGGLLGGDPHKLSSQLKAHATQRTLTAGKGRVGK